MGPPHLYEEYEVECLHELQGMFALAPWDGNEGRLLLACDRMGVKPLYWAALGGSVVYGSEPRLQRGLSRAAEPSHDRYAAMAGQFRPSVLESLCTPEFKRGRRNTHRLG